MPVRDRFLRPLLVSLGIIWGLLLVNGIFSGVATSSLASFLDLSLVAIVVGLPFALYAGTVLAADPDPPGGHSGEWPARIAWWVLGVSALSWFAWNLALPFVEHLSESAANPELFPFGPSYPWTRWAMADSIVSLGPQTYSLDVTEPWSSRPPSRLRFQALQGTGLALMTFVVGLVGLEVGRMSAPLRTRGGMRSRLGMWVLVYALIAIGAQIPFEATRTDFTTPYFIYVDVPPILQLLLLVGLRLIWRRRSG